MSKKSYRMEDIIPDSTKVRKRGCSPTSSTSSILQNYRFKKAVLVGKRGGGSSTTPVPTWRMVASRSPSIAFRVAAESPRYPPSMSGNSRPPHQPVSARKLAATLWEMNEVPSPAMSKDISERKFRKEERRRDRGGRSSVRSGSLPPHLSDPSHSPVSQRMDRSGARSHRKRESSTCRKLKSTDQDIGALDSVSNVSSMEMETRSRCLIPAGSTVGSKSRLKDVSGALTTSKELIKIISRMWGQEDHPSSSMSLISALHTELERARLQVNRLIQEQRTDQNEINYLTKRFAEEKAAWKNKEQQVVQAAVESIMAKLEVEWKLRRRLESLNKKLGTELAETKASLFKALKELESEKRTREVVEQVCDELSRNIGEDRVGVEEMKRDSVRMCEEVEKEREMLHLANALREERAQLKLSEARHQFEDKNAAVDQLRDELEAVFRNKRANKGKGHEYDRRRDTELVASLTNHMEENSGEIEDSDIAIDAAGNSGESDLHSIELNINDINKRDGVTAYPSSMASMYRQKLPAEEDIQAKKSAYPKEPRRSSTSYIQRSVSDMIEWDGLDAERYPDLNKHARRSCQDEMQRYKLLKSLRDRVLSSSKIGFGSPSRHWGQSRPSRDPNNLLMDRSMIAETGNKVAKARRSQH